jgi:Host cell surface-exposed lipoprotein
LTSVEYAINYLHPDWDQQAVDAAKGYLQLGGFSQASLLQQLTSSVGSGFTQAQADYAVNQTMK